PEQPAVRPADEGRQRKNVDHRPGIRVRPGLIGRRGACSSDSDHRRILRGSAASVPIPKFASLCGILSCELRNQRDTSKSMILVPLLNPKFAIGLPARLSRTSGSGHESVAWISIAEDRGKENVKETSPGCSA